MDSMRARERTWTGCVATLLAAALVGWAGEAVALPDGFGTDCSVTGSTRAERGRDERTVGLPPVLFFNQDSFSTGCGSNGTSSTGRVDVLIDSQEFGPHFVQFDQSASASAAARATLGTAGTISSSSATSAPGAYLFTRPDGTGGIVENEYEAVASALGAASWFDTVTIRGPGTVVVRFSIGLGTSTSTFASPPECANASAEARVFIDDGLRFFGRQVLSNSVPGTVSSRTIGFSTATQVKVKGDIVAGTGACAGRKFDTTVFPTVRDGYFPSATAMADAFNTAVFHIDVVTPGGSYTTLSGQSYVTPTGSAPIARAGIDQSVPEGAPVTLDGSASSDPDGDALSYDWTQLAGPAVTLVFGSDPARPTFTAPSVAAGGAVLTFQLVVSDGQFSSAPSTVNVAVTNVNHPPVAEAGADQTVTEGSLVTLDGSSSFDEDLEPLTFLWLQTGGPAVALSDPTASRPTFTAPLVGSEGQTLTFELTVSDGIDKSTDQVRMLVQNINQPPTANAGPDQTVNEGAAVMLLGSASDPDGDALTYAWTQLGGTSVSLSGASTPTLKFTAPAVGPGGDTLVFRLTVDDGAGVTAADQVAVLVQNVNDPPVCAAARPSRTFLWPPNHRLVPVEILAVTDPNNDRVAITITEVTQDEPVNGLRDGDTSPDAMLQGGTVLLRAERAGGGNGRVYRIRFTADDGQGGQCTGAVVVDVPPSMKPGMTAVDDGQLYDATQP